MQSSTVRRSALSRESMDVIESLANEIQTENIQYENSGDYTPREYYRDANTENSQQNNKSKEIDLLWQTFKSAQFNTNSTFVHVLGGFVLGVIVTSVVFSLFGMFAANSDNEALKNKIHIFGNKSQIEQSDRDVENAEELMNESIPADETFAINISSDKNQSKSNKKSSKANIEMQAPVNATKYIIKDGDTVEAIIRNHYGSYTTERADAVMKANNLKDLDHISIDQELLLPVEE